jgi:hypothetical protein
MVAADFLQDPQVRQWLDPRAGSYSGPRARGKLVATPLGKSMLSDERQGSLPAILFHLAFWHTDLGYFGRGLLGSWPQADIGVVLWSLSVSAGDWQTSEKLTRLCTIPEPATLTGTWDRSAYAMEARILRPLLWFGLLEHRSENIPDSGFAVRHYYRKSALFDRLGTLVAAIKMVGTYSAGDFHIISGNGGTVAITDPTVRPRRQSARRIWRGGRRGPPAVAVNWFCNTISAKAGANRRGPD